MQSSHSISPRPLLSLLYSGTRWQLSQNLVTVIYMDSHYSYTDFKTAISQALFIAILYVYYILGLFHTDKYLRHVLAVSDLFILMRVYICIKINQPLRKPEMNHILCGRPTSPCCSKLCYWNMQNNLNYPHKWNYKVSYLWKTTLHIETIPTF